MRPLLGLDGLNGLNRLHRSNRTWTRSTCALRPRPRRDKRVRRIQRLLRSGVQPSSRTTEIRGPWLAARRALWSPLPASGIVWACRRRRRWARDLQRTSIHPAVTRNSRQFRPERSRRLISLRCSRRFFLILRLLLARRFCLLGVRPVLPHHIARRILIDRAHVILRLHAQLI